MIRSRSHPALKGLATGLAVLLLTLGTAVPVLERGALFDRPIVESEHDPGECPSGHDHTICTQVGANLAVEGDHVDGPEAEGALALLRLDGVDIPSARYADRANPPRAPPSA